MNCRWFISTGLWLRKKCMQLKVHLRNFEQRKSMCVNIIVKKRVKSSLCVCCCNIKYILVRLWVCSPQLIFSLVQFSSFQFSSVQLWTILLLSHITIHFSSVQFSSVQLFYVEENIPFIIINPSALLISITHALQCFLVWISAVNKFVLSHDFFLFFPLCKLVSSFLLFQPWKLFFLTSS